MATEKQGNSEDETEQKEKFSDDQSTGTARSYDCIFCKRGFTNAQALGGHMNIHRKEKSKAKTPPRDSSFLKKFNEESMASGNNFSPFPKNHESYYSPLEGHMSSYQPYFPTSNTGHPPALRHRGVLEEPKGADLSLQIGSSHVGGDSKMKKRDGKEDEVDLELRLGYDP